MLQKWPKTSQNDIILFIKGITLLSHAQLELLGELPGDSHKIETIKTPNIYFGLSGHHQELHEGEKYRIFWGVFYGGVEERTREGLSKHVSNTQQFGLVMKVSPANYFYISNSIFRHPASKCNFLLHCVP